MQSGLGFFEGPLESLMDEEPMSSDEVSSSEPASSQLDEPSLSSNEGKNSRHSYTINHLERKEPRKAAPRVPRSFRSRSSRSRETLRLEAAEARAQACT